MPAKVGIQLRAKEKSWIPAYAGMTGSGGVPLYCFSIFGNGNRSFVQGNADSHQICL
jgi:hypothetical protein